MATPYEAKGEGCATKPEQSGGVGGLRMYYVYLLRSTSHPVQKYVGITEDLKKRLSDHNKGFSKHTSKFMPWELVTYHAFYDKNKAYDFEKYLKTGSGKAFASKRFW
jgi:putative endonuclease